MQPISDPFQIAVSAHQEGDIHQAAFAYELILRDDPLHAGAWHLLGVARQQQGCSGEAVECIRRALAIDDSKAVYHNNLGASLLELGLYAEAESAFRRAIELNRDYADAWSNLGRALHLLHSSFDEAERALLSALALRSDHPDALLHLVDVYRDMGRLDDSVSLCERFMAYHGERPDALKRLGETLAVQGNHNRARAVFERGISLAPSDPNLILSLGLLEAGRERICEAKDCFHRAARMRPDQRIWRWKHLGICPSVFSDGEAIERYWQDLNRDLDAAVGDDFRIDWRSVPQNGFLPSFNLTHLNRCCREPKEKFARLFDQAFPHRTPAICAGAGRSRRARIGFLVTAGHENGFLRGTAKIVGQLDATRFEPIVFCARRGVDLVRRTVRRLDLTVASLPPRFDWAVEMIRQANCDVLYYWKVGADPWNQFLPMAKLAPVQCTSWGTHGTSGIAAVDYYLSSPLMETDVPGIDVGTHYTECLALLPTFPTFQEREARRPPCTRDDFGLPDRGAIYLCPHRLPKYHPDFDVYLGEILDQDPSGHVVLLCGHPSDGQTLLGQRIRRNLGESLSRRLFLRSAMPVDQYYQLLSLAAVVLDSFVYAGGITAYDAFSYGIPVVTQPGALAVQNYTAGLYRRMGISELTAKGRREYVDIAVRVGTDGDYREGLSRRLLEQGDSIFEDSEATPAHEQFFLEALERLETR